MSVCEQKQTLNCRSLLSLIGLFCRSLFTWNVGSDDVLGGRPGELLDTRQLD
jgi:hypothetical protein